MMVSVKRFSVIVFIGTHLGLQIAAADLSPLAYSSEEILGPAIEVRQVLTGHGKRQSDTVGSWSLRALSCPEDTQDCGDSSITACCTKNTICVENVYKFACCPSEADCHRTAESLPSCADPSWSLWRNEDRDGYFCCLPGQRGYRTSSRFGACSDERIVLQPSQTLSSITPYKVSGDVVQNNPTRTGDSVSETRPTDSTEANTGQDTPNQKDDEDSKSGNGLSTGAIAGVVGGGIVLLIAFAFGIWWAGKEGARKGAAAAAASIYAQQQQQQQEKPRFHVDDPSFNGETATYQPPSAPQPINTSHFEAVTGRPEIVAMHSIHPQTRSTQWAYEVDGHNLGTDPNSYSEMEGR